MIKKVCLIALLLSSLTAAAMEQMDSSLLLKRLLFVGNPTRNLRRMIRMLKNVMKKQILALIAYAAILAPISGFCMEVVPGMKKVNLVVRFDQTECAPANVYAAITFECKGNNVHLRIKDLGPQYSEKREVCLPAEGNSVKFICHFEVVPENELNKEKRRYSNSFTKTIEQSFLLEGATLLFHLDAGEEKNETYKRYYEVAASLRIQAADQEEKNSKIQIRVINKSGSIVQCKNFINRLNGQYRYAGFLALNDTAIYTSPIMENPPYFQFVCLGFCQGPRIEMTKDNDQGKFELYSLLNENGDVQKGVFRSRRIEDSSLEM